MLPTFFQLIDRVLSNAEKEKRPATPIIPQPPPNTPIASPKQETRKLEEKNNITSISKRKS